MKNNMIDFINLELPYIFFAQELSWFYPNYEEVTKIKKYV
jgi:hypothetical protein